MDRRIRRTRTAVFNAVLDLMVEKDTAKLPFLNFASVQILTKVHFICTIKVWKTACKTVFRL